jgi:long-chain acyl-CoA synthetase
LNISTLLSNSARSFGARPAICIGDKITHTYAQLYGRSARLAAGLQLSVQLKPGDRVALVMSNCPAYLEVLFAIWHAGLAAVPINAKLHAREVAVILDDCKPSLCFVTRDLANVASMAAADAGCVKRIVCVDDSEYEALMHDPSAAETRSRDDLAWLFYTSGTTGRPKGAMLSHLNLQLMAWSYLCDFDLLTENDSLLHLGPQSHAAGLLALSHVAKASLHILPESGAFDPREIASIIDRAQGVTFFAAPTMLRRLVENTEIVQCRVEHVRTILGGAAPFFADDVKRILNTFGPRFTNGYGQGECPCTISAMPKRLYSLELDDQHLVSVGIARTGVEIQIVDSEGRAVAPGEIGEILVRSDIVMRGYWQNPQASERTLAGGWLHTGDLGVMDDLGYLWLKDRSKDLIISGGSNIYPREVEDVLLLDSSVAEASVVGEPDPEWGESVVAFIVSRQGYCPTSAQLDRLCLDNLARFKRPKRYLFVDELPKNSTGKVLKTELRARILRSTPTDGSGV